METKKKVILFSSISLGLLGLGFFGWKKGWFSKKQGGEGANLSSLENLIAGANKDKTPKTTTNTTTKPTTSVSTASSKLENLIAGAKKDEENNVSTASSKTTPTYQATGENNGLDLYHKMVSMCAECYDNTGRKKDTDYLVEYFKKSGARGETYSGGCYRAIQELYKDDPYFDEAMSLVGSKEQFRRDINQYRKDGTFRI